VECHDKILVRLEVVLGVWIRVISKHMFIMLNFSLKVLSTVRWQMRASWLLTSLPVHISCLPVCIAAGGMYLICTSFKELGNFLMCNHPGAGPEMKPLIFNIFFNFLVWGETESTWYVGLYLACCTNPGIWVMMSVLQSLEWELAEETEVLRMKHLTYRLRMW
jgi:hypothetical protein